MQTIYFYDQDGDCYTITDCYLDSDGDICLEAGEGTDMDASGMLFWLDGHPGNTYVYINCVFDDIICDIEDEWYVDDDDDVCIDIYYQADDDDDYYDDEERSYIEKEWTSNECPKCGSSNIDSRYSFDTDKVL